MQLKKRGREAERLAEQAWDNLTSAVESTGRRTRKMAGDTQSRVSSSSDEARRRASAAMDALAGRKPRRPWSWLAGALALGAALGWLATAFGKKAVTETSRMLDREPKAEDLLTAEPTEFATRPM